MATTQDQRNLQLTTPLGKDVLLINGLRCSEGLNQLFHVDIEMLFEMGKEGFEPKVIDPKSLLGSPMVVAALQVQTSDLGLERYFHGMCVSFTQGSRNGRFTSFRAELVPAVWLLTQRSQSRIFQAKSVPEILQDVLDGFDVAFEIQGTFERRNYCVQYRETDWDFASRLMEEEGIYYYFEHTKDKHQLILANTPASHRPCPTFSKVPFGLERSELKEQWIPAVYSWQTDNKIRTGKYQLGDFHFEVPTNRLTAEHMSLFDLGINKRLEIYDWPGEYAQRFDGIDRGGGEQPEELRKVFQDRERTVRIRQEEIDVAYKNIYGTANCCTITAGYKFELSKHPIKANNIEHVLVSVLHEAVQSPNYISGAAVPNDYLVNFICIPHGPGQAPFRPARRTRKPVVQGSQTAFVVGPAGEEIFTDKYGRVKVQFHWDRHGKMDELSSCWLRVAQISSGNGWGSMFIPRIGTEVMINFLEGDPDQPIIAGCVYNPATMPPYKLPEHKTRSTIKTRSSKGGGGFNEIRFEDKKGEEQIFIHAQKNQDVRVNHDCMETIGSDRHLIVGGDQREKVYADKHLQVVGDLYEKIESSTSLQVGGDKDEKIGSKYAAEAGNEIHLKAGMKVVIEAGVQLTLKGPGGFIDIGPGGVTVQGTMVLINSGGSAGSGSGSSPTSPKFPKEADRSNAGTSTDLPEPPLPPSPSLTKTKIAAKKVKKQKDKGRSRRMSKAEAEKLVNALNEEIERIKNIVRLEKGKGLVKDVAEKIIGHVIAAKEGLPFVMSDEKRQEVQKQMLDEARIRSWKSGKPEPLYPGSKVSIIPATKHPTPEDHEVLLKDATKKAWREGKPAKVYQGGTSIMPLSDRPPPQLAQELFEDAKERARKSGKPEESYKGGTSVIPLKPPE